MNLGEDRSLVAGTSDERAVKDAISPAATSRRQRRPWLLAGISWRTINNLRTHKRVEEFLKLPPFVDAVQDNPKFAFKYLTESYLLKGISITDRAACFLHHYKRLYESLPDRLLRQVLHWGIDVCDFSEEGIGFTLKWGSSRPFGKEGEMSLLLLADGEILFTISFTIVPGEIVKSRQGEVLLISRIQGAPGWPSDKMRAAQRALHKLRFGAVLLAGLEGIASAFAIKEIHCVTSANQISFAEAYADRFKHAYDDFFEDMGIPKTEAGFFSTTVPIPERAIEDVKDHKARARARRALKKKITLSCVEYLSATMRIPAESTESQISVQAVVRPEGSPENSSPESRQAALQHERSSLSFG